MTSVPSTWQEAFRTQSISAVKDLESQLRTNSARDKERLRILVGGNYRDLLRTADQIIELDGAVRSVETGIARLSSICTPPETPATSRKIQPTTSIALQFQTVNELLNRVVSPSGRSSILLTAQRIVIARLILRSVQESSPLIKLHQTLAARLKRCQSIVVARIDHVLSRPAGTLLELATALAAYSLVFACSPHDGIQHFHQIRLAKLSEQEDEESLSRAGLLTRCQYVVHSAIALKGLHGRIVVDIVNSLQRKPIIQNVLADSPRLSSLYTLLPVDIQNFTPYIPKNSATARGANEAMVAWTDDATKVLLKHLTSCISTQKLTSVLATRRDVLDLLLVSCFSAKMHDRVIPEVERTFSDRIVELIRASCRQLIEHPIDLNTHVHDSEPRLLWDTKWLEAQRADQGGTTRQCRARYLGIGKDLEHELRRISLWSRRCLKHRALLRELRNIRWQDKIEDHDEEEDEDVASMILTRLTQDSAGRLMAIYDETLSEVVSKFVQQISEACGVLGRAVGESEYGQEYSHITNWMRFLRESHPLLKGMLPSAAPDRLQLEVTRLQSILVERVLVEWRGKLAQLETTKIDLFVPDELPTVRATRAMQQLCVLMAERGGHDIWTRPAVDALKTMARSSVLEGKDRNLYISSTFDELYFRAALTTSLASCEATDQERTHAQKRATAYWTRTRSLFGVLDL